LAPPQLAHQSTEPQAARTAGGDAAARAVHGAQVLRHSPAARATAEHRAYRRHRS